MNFTVTFRRSKLARQILILFLICALLMRFLADQLIEKGSGHIIKDVKDYHQPNVKHFNALGMTNYQGVQYQLSGHFNHIPSLD